MKRLADCLVILDVLPPRRSSSIRRATRLLGSLAALAAASLQAHPDIDEALSRLNALIATSPENADLYIERGEVYARHDDLVSAEANYLRATELAPNSPRLARARGSLEFANGHLAEARTFFDRTLAANANDAETLVLRARTRSALNERSGALGDYDRALALIENPPPEIYLERASLYPAPGDALRSLNEALARIGPVISLQIRALQLEESQGLVDAALARVDQLAAQTERKEVWLKRRGDILTRAGRTADAVKAYAAALEAIATLPDWLRNSPDTLRLAAELTRLTATRS